MTAGSTDSLRRAFLAVVPASEVLAALDDALEPVRAVARPPLSWARSSQWHLTMQFLGPVTEVDAVVDVVGAAVRDHGAFFAGLRGAGAFPTADRASVLWVGLDEGAESLGALAGVVQGATAPLGFLADDRPFTPHLTVARSRHPCAAGSVLAAIGDGPFGRTWDVREVVLFESDTRPTGAVHREIAVLPLGVAQPNR